jgi:excisionase family DNA binding protein
VTVKSIAELFDVSERQVHRWAADGKIPGAYRTKGGHLRFQKLSPDEVEAIIRFHIERFLRDLRAEFFPRLDDFMELALIHRNILSSDDVSISPLMVASLKDPETRLRIRATTLRLQGQPVTAKTLARSFHISVRTLSRRFGGQIVKKVCTDTQLPIYPEAPSGIRFDINPAGYGRQSGDDSSAP